MIYSGWAVPRFWSGYSPFCRRAQLGWPLQPRDGSGFRWYLVLVFLSSLFFCSSGRGDLTSLYSGSRLPASPTKMERKGERKNQTKKEQWQNKQGKTYENFTHWGVVDTVDKFVSLVDMSRSISTVHADSPTGEYGWHRWSIPIHRSKKSVDIDRRCRLIQKKSVEGRYRPSKWTHTHKALILREWLAIPYRCSHCNVVM